MSEKKTPSIEELVDLLQVIHRDPNYEDNRDKISYILQLIFNHVVMVNDIKTAHSTIKTRLKRNNHIPDVNDVLKRGV
jgi:arginine deiminase